LNNATIMVIEDESIIARDIESILKNYGYNVAGPYSKAEDAILALNHVQPDLILMDIVLKGDIDGIEAAIIIKEKISVPIIYLTAYADDITIGRIKNTDPYGYFLKPFEEKELHSWIETTLYKFNKEEKLKKNEKWLKSVIRSFDKAVITVNEAGVIKTVNNNAEKLTGFKEDEISGKHFDNSIKIFKENKNTGEYLSEGIIKTGVPVTDNNRSLLFRNKIKIPISYVISPVVQDECTIGYIITITEKDSGNTDKELIRELNEKLEISKKEIKQLAYVASHDLQEPLRMIASYVQLLQKRYKGKIDDGADEFISFAVEGVNRMKTLLNDLLVYSRLNTVPAVFEITDFSVIVKQAIKSIQNEFPGKHFVVNYSALPTLKADSSQMRQLFHNLLSNAVKFNDKDKAAIDISYKNENGSYEFKISDNGIGMDSEYYTRIFEVFQRLHHYNEYPGTGIGLAICKKIAENHNGSIRVESIPNKGSIFYIKFSNNG